MKQSESIYNYLTCPKCKGEDFSQTKDHALCSSCSMKYPITAGIPWLFTEPTQQIADWQNKYHLFLDLNRLEVQKLKLELQRPELMESTKDRLKRIIQGKIEHGREIAKVLEPIQIKEDHGPDSSKLTGGTDLPETQGLMSYYSNVCRDWSYGDDENGKCLSEIEQVLGEDRALGILGVIGSGASRLAYDIHQHFKVASTLNTDINPFLLMSAKRIIQGRPSNFYEFPIAPINLESFAVKVRCKAPTTVKDNFYFALADGMNPIFKSDSLDTLLTPWLIDIVHQDLKEQFRRYNSCLKLGGRWVNFGSLSFFHADQTICYSLEETLQIVEDSGFKIESYRHEEIPYLHSPYSCQKRFERVLTFSARKTKNVAQPEQAFEFLPEWLRDWDKPIPSIQANQQQAVIHEVLGLVFKLIDGQRSINQMAREADFLQLPPQNGAVVISNVLKKFFNEKLKGQQF